MSGTIAAARQPEPDGLREDRDRIKAEYERVVGLLDDAAAERDALRAAARQPDEDTLADIRQAATGGPDFTVAEWPARQPEPDGLLARQVGQAERTAARWAREGTLSESAPPPSPEPLDVARLARAMFEVDAEYRSVYGATPTQYAELLAAEYVRLATEPSAES